MRFFLLAITIIISFASMAQRRPTAGYGVDSLAHDIALVYQGSDRRPDWTAEEIRPYVVHQFQDGTKSWFFDSYLVYDFRTANNIYTGGFENYWYKLGTGWTSKDDKFNSTAHPAKKDEWTWLLDRHFGKGICLNAIEQVIESYKPELGEPLCKRSIVLGLPSPTENQTDWGELDGKALDFNKLEDQLAAVEWYIDEAERRFNEANFKNLQLVGFYCMEEDLVLFGDMPKYMSEILHKRGYRYYWIPYFDVKEIPEWKSYGFDMVYIQPNYAFKSELPESRLEVTCANSKYYNTGLEMEWEYDCSYGYGNGKFERVVKYVDAYEEYDVFNKSSIAYYSGSQALRQFANSAYAQDRQLLDRIAYHVKTRQEGRAAGVNSLNADNTNEHFAAGGAGGIYISERVKAASIYSINGSLLYKGNGFYKCSPGIYIVTNEYGKSTRVVVK